MTRFSKKTLALAISSLLAANVNAAMFNLYNADGDPKTSASLNYAKETKFPTDGTGVILYNNNAVFTDSALDVAVDLGWELSFGDEFHPRFDLTNAKFSAGNADMQADVLTSADGALTPPHFSQSPNGGVGQSYIFYSFENANSPGGTDSALLAEARVSLTYLAGANPAVDPEPGDPQEGNAIKVLTKGPVDVSYAVYQTPSGAFSQTASARLGSVRTAELLNFTRSAIDVSFDKTSAAVGGVYPKIDVGNSSKTFDVALNDEKTLISVGKVTVKNTDGIYLANGRKLAEGAPTIVIAGNGTQLVVYGDFAAASTTDGKVFLDTTEDGNTCDDVSLPGTLSEEADEASFTIDDDAGEFIVCMLVDGETTINGGQYTATYKPVSANAASYTVSDQSGSLYKLDRNGAILQSPFFNLVPGYVPRFYLTNTGAKEAPFTIQLFTDAAATGTLVAGTTTSGTIPAGGAILLKADQIATGGQRGAAVFQVLGLDENINGLYQFRNTKTGNFDSIVMPHKAYIYGPAKE